MKKIEKYFAAHYTPDAISLLMMYIAEKYGPLKTILDPACGNGALLKAAPAEVLCFGCDIRPEAFDDRFPNLKFYCGDGLTTPHLRTDAIIMNPPFNINLYFDKPRFARLAGVPISSMSIDWAFMIMAYHTARRVVVVLLPTTRLINAKFQAIRKNFLPFITEVIDLKTNFKKTDIEYVSIVVLTPNQSTEEIYLCDLTNEGNIKKEYDNKGKFIKKDAILLNGSILAAYRYHERSPRLPTASSLVRMMIHSFMHSLDQEKMRAAE